MGKLPPLLPTPGKQSFPGSHLPLPAKSPLLGDRPGGALLPPPGQCFLLVIRDSRSSAASTSSALREQGSLLNVKILGDQERHLGVQWVLFLLNEWLKF